MGIGDWGLGIGPNPQSPIPNPQIVEIFKFKYLLYVSSIKDNKIHNLFFLLINIF